MKRLRNKPVTDPFEPCNTEKRNRISNRLLRMGEAAAAQFYTNEIVRLQARIHYYTFVKTHCKMEMKKYPDGTTEEWIARKKFFYADRAVIRSKAKLERFRRFLSTIEQN